MKEFPSPFDLYVELGEYYEKNGLFGINHSRLARYENLWQFIRTQIPDRADSYREWLTLDLYLRENVKKSSGICRGEPGHERRDDCILQGRDRNPQILERI